MHIIQKIPDKDVPEINVGNTVLFLCRKGEANGEERHAFDHLQDIEILVRM